MEQTAKKLEKVDGELNGLKNVSRKLWPCYDSFSGGFASNLSHHYKRNGGLFQMQGFLAKDLQAEALGKLDHRVKVAAEQFMKILEKIDAMVIISLHLSVSF